LWAVFDVVLLFSVPLLTSLKGLGPSSGTLVFCFYQYLGKLQFHSGEAILDMISYDLLDYALQIAAVWGKVAEELAG